LVRFCTQAYTTDKKSLKQKCTHLTNYSINKKAENFAKNEGGEEADDSGDKWSTRALRAYFQKNGIDDKAVWADIKDVIVKTIIMAESFVVTAMARGGVSRKSCFEVFGFDVLLDANLKPWLMEVNVGPSVASSSPLDKVIKGSMTTDMFDLLGLPLADLKQMRGEGKAQQENEQKGKRTRPGSGRSGGVVSSQNKLAQPQSRSKKLALSSSGNGKEEFTKSMSVSSRPKTQMQQGSRDVRGLFQPEEVELLREVHEEYARSKLGHFRRIFPKGLASDQRLFDLERAKNTVVQRWLSLPAETREAVLKSPGIEERHRDGAWWGLRNHGTYKKRASTSKSAVRGPRSGARDGGTAPSLRKTLGPRMVRRPRSQLDHVAHKLAPSRSERQRAQPRMQPSLNTQNLTKSSWSFTAQSSSNHAYNKDDPTPTNESSHVHPHTHLHGRGDKMQLKQTSRSTQSAVASVGGRDHSLHSKGNLLDASSSPAFSLKS
jgi:hypothetical protein